MCNLKSVSGKNKTVLYIHFYYTYKVKNNLDSFIETLSLLYQNFGKYHFCS